MAVRVNVENIEDGILQVVDPNGNVTTFDTETNRYHEGARAVADSWWATRDPEWMLGR